MRGHRNPRYAPEYLERKLNPSGLAGIPVSAEIYFPNTQLEVGVNPSPAVLLVSANVATAPEATTQTDQVPTRGPGDPPIDDPIIPIGPAGPA